MNRIDLKKVFMSLKKAVNKNVSLDMKIQAKDDYTSFTTTNLGTSITATTDESIGGNFSGCVDIYKLYKLLQKGTSLPDEWSFTYQDDVLRVHDRFELPVKSSVDFPELSEGKDVNDSFIAGDSKRLLEITQKADDFMSTGDSRSYLKGLFLDSEDKLAVATDAHTMARFGFPVQMYDDYLVQRDTIEKLAYVLKKTKYDGSVEIETMDNVIKFSFGPGNRGFTWEIAGLLIDEEFLDHNQVVPDTFEGFYTFDREELEAELKALKQVANNDTRKMILNPDGTIETEEGDGGEYKHTLKCETTGEVSKAAYNADYFYKIVSSCETEEIKFNFISEDSPTVIKDGKDKYLIMPMRL